jgi:exopolysaccharide production protein ExoQ
MKVEWRERISGRAAGSSLTNGILLAAMIWFMVLTVCLPDAYSYTGPITDASGDNSLRRSLWLATFFAACLVLLLRYRLAWRVLREVNVFYLLWLGLAFASLAWSVDPDLTGRKLVRLMMMCTVFLAVAVIAWEPRRFQHLLRPVLTFICLASIVFAYGWPDLALHHEPNPELINAWHGICLTKNQLGATASFAYILWAHAWFTRETARIWAFLGGGAALLCLVMSRSQTSLIASIVGTMVIFLMLGGANFRLRHARVFVIVFAGILLLFAMAMLRVIPGLETILEPIPWITGKDLTFSNRAQIWAVVVEHIQRRPLLGSGYGAFWLPNLPTPDKDSFFVTARLNGLYPGSSHNGYLQVLNDLGAVGLIFLLGYIALFIRQSLRLYGVDRTQGALFIGLLLQQAIINMEEPNWLNSIIVDFVPMSVATTCLARALLEAKLGIQSGSQRGVVGGSRQSGAASGRNHPARTRILSR